MQVEKNYSSGIFATDRFALLVDTKLSELTSTTVLLCCSPVVPESLTRDNRSSLQKLLSFRYQKKQTKWPLRESFSLVQNILFDGYIKVLPAHQWENIIEKLWETM